MLVVTEAPGDRFRLRDGLVRHELAVGTWSAAMPGLPIPQGMDYVPLCVGGALIALFACEKLVLPAPRRRGRPCSARTSLISSP